MSNILIGAAWRPYVRALADIGLDAASVGAWIAFAELPPLPRRLARGALAAVTAAVTIPGTRAGRSDADTTEVTASGSGSKLPFVDVGITLPGEKPEIGVSPRRRAAQAGAVGAVFLTAALAVSVGAAAAGRHLERRWLARLTRQGHLHPHRALGMRMAALFVVMVAPSRLLDVRKGVEADREKGEPATGGAGIVSG